MLKKKIEKTRPSKIKVRKHLNEDALMSAFAIFALKSPLLLKFDNKRKDLAESQNLKTDCFF